MIILTVTYVPIYTGFYYIFLYSNNTISYKIKANEKNLSSYQTLSTQN